MLIRYRQFKKALQYEVLFLGFRFHSPNQIGTFFGKYSSCSDVERGPGALYIDNWMI